MSEKKTVIIVGAGLAGLCAARLLQQYEVDVVVLEAKKRVGGRTEYDKEYGVDLGGTFVGNDKKRSLYIAEQLGVKTTPVYKEGLTTFSINNEVSHIKCQIPNWEVLHPFALLGLLKALFWDLNSKAKKVPALEPWNAENAEEWDEMTTEEWIKTYSLPDVRTFLRFVVQVLLGVEPSEISFLYFLWYIRVGHRFPGILTEAQDATFIGGSQQLSEKMAEKLGSGRVHLNDKVVAIDQSGDKVTVTTEKNASYIGSYCILAVTPGVRDTIIFTPQMNGLYHQYPQRMPMGSIIKTFAFYETTWWRTKGYNGIATITDGLTVGQTYDVTQPGGRPCIMGFVLGKRARKWQEKTQEERKDAVTKEYARVFEAKEALNPTDFIEKDWLTNIYTGGSGGVAPCGVTTTYKNAVRCPVDRIHFASTETATDWSGYMDGAIQSGWRAAGEILTRLGITFDNPEDKIEHPKPVILHLASSLTKQLLEKAIATAKEEQLTQATALPKEQIDVSSLVCKLKEIGFCDDKGWLTSYVTEQPEDVAELLGCLHYSAQILNKATTTV